jgi:hypothetical protein
MSVSIRQICLYASDRHVWKHQTDMSGSIRHVCITYHRSGWARRPYSPEMKYFMMFMMET